MLKVFAISDVDDAAAAAARRSGTTPLGGESRRRRGHGGSGQRQQPRMTGVAAATAVGIITEQELIRTSVGRR